ncbi:hypothetical protein DPEC_G00134540 [Dallia pectoralis]|uniref:Uncharacterized protein n=1 Tax=Dallia pectoralis TaxID=75939 RepID=A0ACC2GS12_DALPE|nr:hypothetical protein DPEC_G00134540 [Dallia pectoralis]
MTPIPGDPSQSDLASEEELSDDAEEEVPLGCPPRRALPDLFPRILIDGLQCGCLTGPPQMRPLTFDLSSAPGATWGMSPVPLPGSGVVIQLQSPMRLFWEEDVPPCCDCSSSPPAARHSLS